MKFKRSVMGLAALVMFPALAIAENGANVGPYIGGGIGYGTVKDQAFDFAGTRTSPTQPTVPVELPAIDNDGIAAENSYKGGLAYRAVGGFRFENGLRPEVDLSFASNKVDEVSYPDPTRGIEPSAKGVTAAQQALMFNLWYDLFPSSKIHPYIGGGIGVERTKLDKQPTNQLTHGVVVNSTTNDPLPGPPVCLAEECAGPRKSDDASLAFQIGAGVRWDVTQGITAGLDYRYLKAAKQKFYGFKDQQETHLDSDIETMAVMFSLNYFFVKPLPPPPPPEPAQVVAPIVPPDGDGDGVPDDLDRCPGTAAGVQVDTKGCPLPPPCEAPEPGQKVDLSGCATGASIVLRGVNFEFDQSRLTPNAELILDSVAESLNAYPTIKVELGGHTDSLGSDGYNERLSQRRADAVVAYLSAKGVAAERMTAMGYGETVPVSENETEEGRELNRRVELKVTSGAAEAGVSVSDGTSAPAAEAAPTVDAAAPEAAPADPVASEPATEPAAGEPAAAPADGAVLTP